MSARPMQHTRARDMAHPCHHATALPLDAASGPDRGHFSSFVSTLNHPGPSSHHIDAASSSLLSLFTPLHGMIFVPTSGRLVYLTSDPILSSSTQPAHKSPYRSAIVSCSMPHSSSTISSPYLGFCHPTARFLRSSATNMDNLETGVS